MFETEPILAGPRFDLRPFTEADIDDTYIGWLNDPEVMRYSNQRFRTHDRKSCLAYVQSFAGTDNYFLLATRRVDAKPFGTLTVYASRPHGTADVGIMIGERSMWGQGYGQEAWDLVVAWLLSEPRIRKVTAGAVVANGAMVRVMERSAMIREGTRRAQEIIDGKPSDIVYYARFRDA
jgi:ribosomal-protein-alanine N-acetyltransferase